MSLSDSDLEKLLKRTGKKCFVDLVPYCLTIDKTSDIIKAFKSDHKHEYTIKSYQTRVANVKRIIRAGRIENALEGICESKVLDNSIIQKAVNFLNEEKIEAFSNIDNELNRLIDNKAEYHGLDRLAKIRVRVGQQKFREQLLAKWERCSVTGYENRQLLIASHIKPWSLSNNAEKVDVNNGLLLIPNLDRAFDSGMITFNNDGKIKISKKFKQSELLGICLNMSICMSKGMLEYMEYHRKNIFKN